MGGSGHTTLRGQKNPCRVKPAPHGECMRACRLDARLPPSLLSEVRLGCPKSSPSFLLVEKRGPPSLAFPLLPQVLLAPLASVRAALLPSDRDIAAWLTMTATRLLSSLWPRGRVRVRLCPFPLPSLPSSPSLPLYVFPLKRQKCTRVSGIVLPPATTASACTLARKQK